MRSQACRVAGAGCARPAAIEPEAGRDWAPRTRSHADRAGGCCRVGQARTPADNDGGHHGRVLPSLAVIYTWEEQSALDATWAVNILFLLAMLASAGLITYILTLGDSSAEYLAAMYAPGGARARALGLAAYRDLPRIEQWGRLPPAFGNSEDIRADFGSVSSTVSGAVPGAVPGAVSTAVSGSASGAHIGAKTE